MANENAKLFQPIRVGDMKLSHRIVLAPLTRYRASDALVPTEMMADMYAQRANPPGTFIIAEATIISPRGGGYENAPGIWNEEQVEGWKRVTAAVHAQGSYIYCQLLHLGWTADPEVLGRVDPIANPGGPYRTVGPSNIPNPERPVNPVHELTHEEVLQTIQDFRTAARSAIQAGFDGVEVHGAHGYLVDEFLQDNSNQRTDQWGGNIANRSRFGLEVMREVVEEVGEERASIRLSPFNTVQGMHMKHPQPQFAHFVSRLRELYPRLSYLHVVEPRVAGTMDRKVLAWESNDFLRVIWKGPDKKANGSVYLSAGGYTPQTAIDDAENKGDLIAFGRLYIPNPDLPMRIKKGLALTPYDRKTFYLRKDPKGYIDYSFADAESEAQYRAYKKTHTASL